MRARTAVGALLGACGPAVHGDEVSDVRVEGVADERQHLSVQAVELRRTVQANLQVLVGGVEGRDHDWFRGRRRRLLLLLISSSSRSSSSTRTAAASGLFCGRGR